MDFTILPIATSSGTAVFIPALSTGWTTITVFTAEASWLRLLHVFSCFWLFIILPSPLRATKHTIYGLIYNATGDGYVSVFFESECFTALIRRYVFPNEFISRVKILVSFFKSGSYISYLSNYRYYCHVLIKVIRLGGRWSRVVFKVFVYLHLQVFIYQ